MKLVGIPDRYKEHAKEILEESLEEDYDSVIVFGFIKEENQFVIKSSPVHDRLAVLGALSEAQFKLVSEGYL
jgi:hypothetical protein